MTLRRLVLQPQTDPVVVRRWLSEHAFRHTAERLVLDRGRFYTLIAAEHRPETETEGLLLEPALTEEVAHA